MKRNNISESVLTSWARMVSLAIAFSRITKEYVEHTIKKLKRSHDRHDGNGDHDGNGGSGSGVCDSYVCLCVIDSVVSVCVCTCLFGHAALPCTVFRSMRH